LDFNYALPVRGISYSLNFKNGDSVYISNNGFTQKDTTYTFLLNKIQGNEFANLITKLNLGKLDTLYESHDIDGEEYRLTISKNDSLKSVYVHSFDIPNDLRELSTWLTEFKRALDQISSTNNH
jgi:hypothetical protein